MTSKARWQVAWLPEALRGRATLLSRTALGTVATLLVATPSRAQPAASARPTDGIVTAGSASIGTSASTTTITQSSQRTAINWQSFNVGSQQTVDFIQPSSSSVALNRVISSNPSQIAGHIDANGQIILINQSGVIFDQGAQVNTAGLIVSAAGMSNVNFMAGKLVFDQAARPNAAVVNQGSLTVRQAGLAALVAPQVANSGVINAKLGHVVLAGAKTATLDLYGDGLVALDVNNQVTQTTVGPDGKAATALVTNTGVIQADGGTVQLTAREADGLVQNLVQAGGKISADSVGSKTGAVVLGGSIVLSGVVTADGSAPGTTGGRVQVDASGAVTLAAGARVSASGPAGGGTVAIGTTLARAAGGPGTVSTLTARTVQVAQGASIAANATADGDGGRVTVLSSLSTSMAGKITALGGPRGGNGGFIETSGEWLGIGAGAVIDARALSATGKPGTWLLDPLTLDVVAGSTDTAVNKTAGPPFTVTPNNTPPGTAAKISNGTIDGELNGGTNVVLTTTSTGTGSGDIRVDPGAAITWTTGATLTMNSVGAIIIDAPITNTTNAAAALILNAAGVVGQDPTNGAISVGNLAITSVGAVTLLAPNSVATLAASVSQAGNSFQFNNTAAPLTVGTNGGGTVVSGITTLNGAIDLTTTTSGAITLTGSVNAGSAAVALTSAGAITESGGAIIAGTLTGSAVGAATLSNAGNAIANLGPFSSVENFTLNDAPTGATSTLTVVGTVLASAGLAPSVLDLTVAGNLIIGPATGPAAGLSGGAVDLVTTATRAATGTISETALGSLTASTLTGSAAASVLLSQHQNNQVGSLAGFIAGSGFVLSDHVALTVTSAVNAGTGALSLASTGQIVVNANLTTSGAEIDLASAPRFAFTNTAAIASGGGNIVVLADDMKLGGLGGTINSGGGVVVLGPALPTLDVVLGAASTTTLLGLQTTDLATITAGMVQIGYAAENGAASFTGAISIGGTGGISINPATIPALLLLTGGSVSQTQPLVFSAAGGTLGVIAGGNVILGGAGNAVDTIAGFAGNSGNFTFVNGQALTVGTMPAQQLGVSVNTPGNGLASSAPLATGAGLPSNKLTGVTTFGGTDASPSPGVIVLQTTAGDLALNAPVNANNGSTSLVATPNLVGLQAFGNITQTAAGVVSAVGVEALAGGSVTLDAAPNQIGNVLANGQPGGVAGTSTGSFSLLDSGQLLVTNILAVSAGITLTIATGVVTSNADINLASGGLVLNQPLNAGGGTVRLVESGAVSQQSAGIITAGSLSVTDSGGPVVLEALNAVDTVATSLTSGGSAFTLQDVGTPLTIGSVAAAPLAEDPNAVFGSVTGAATNGGDINLATGGLAVNAAVAAGAGTVRLLEFGAVSQAPGSPITAGALAVTDSGGQVVLETANAIGTLAAKLTFAGGALSFNNGTTVVTVGNIVAAGSGVDPGGVFNAVTGLTTGDADINLLSGGLTLSNAVNAGAGTVRLLESGAVSQAAGGVISAGSLAVTDSGGPVVLEAANAVGMVAANVTSGGAAFSFNDSATALIIGSVVGAPGGEDPAILFAATVTGASTRNGDINLASKGLAMNEAVGAGSGTVRLVDSGRLSQLAAGGITAGSLAVTLGDGSAGLGATNAIGTVAGKLTFTGGAFNLNDGTTALTVGSVAAAPGGPGSEDPLGVFASAVTGVTTSAGNITLQAAGITLNQAVSAGTANVTLTSAGAISQGASGAITAADLNAETELDAGGSISLTSPGNKVGKATLTSLNGAGNALGSGAIAFVDGVALTIANLSLLQTGVATIGAVQLADTGPGITVEMGAAVTGSSVEIGVSAANGLFTNDGAVAATVSGVAPVGDVVILANTMSLSGGTISAPDAVVLGPFTTGVGVTLGGAVGGTLSLQASDIASITAGLLQIGYAGLTGDIAIAGPLSLSAPQVSALALVTGGKIGEAAGVGVSFAGTGSLALVAGGSVAMQGGNQVSTLAGSAGGLGQSFVFNNLNLPLTVGTFPLALVGVVPDGNNFPVPSAGATPSGVVTSNGNITLATATSGDLVLDAPVNAAIGTVALDSVGAITQSAGGIVTAGTLTTSSTGGTTLGDTNKVAALGTSTDTSATGITLVDGEALTVVGAVTAAANATLTLTTAGTLAIGAAGKVGVLNAGTVALTAAGGISEPNGSIVAGTLTVATTAPGDVSLGSATNHIGTDAGISVNSGDLVLVDAANLTLIGNQSANNLFFEVNGAGGALQIGSNFIGATLSAAAGSNARISLVADNITEGFTPGSIATAGGTGGSGTVELAPFTGSRPVSLAGASGSAMVIDAGLIGIIDTGTVNVGRYTAVPAGGGFVTSAQSIMVAGLFNLTGHAVTLGLYSQFGISESGGEIVVGTLTGSAGEGAANLSVNNLVGTLGPFTSFSGFALTDNEALTVVGPVTDSGTGAGVSLTTTTGGITLAGAINAGGDTLTLISAGSIVQTGGSIDVATLSGSAATSANLTAAGNLVGAVGGFATAAGLVLIDNEALTVNGPVTDSGVGQTMALTTTTGGITLGGVISAAGDTLDLVSAGAISQSGGSINVGTLTGSAVGSANLTAATNLVGTLGAFSSAGGFALTVNQALLVNGPVTDSGSGRTVALTTGVGDLTLAGVISAPRDTLDLVSAGAISQTGGSIDVATLTGSAVGSGSLTQAGNTVGTLAAFSTGSGFTLIDKRALTVSGPVSDSGTGGLVELVTSIGGITLSGAISAGNDTLELVSAGSINQTGGAIDVATLTGSAVGSARLTQAGNLVGTLAVFSTASGFALTSNEALTVSGPVTDSGTAQTVTLTTETGGITLDGAVGAAGDTLALVSAGAIIQPGGSIDVATLRGSAVGLASLTQAANVVVTLGPFSTGAGFALVDGQALAVNGPVTDSGSGQTVALTTEAGDITSAGAISAGGDTLDLVSAGSITQAGGSIVVADLTGSAVGSASFAQATNLIGTLAGFSTGSGFALTTNEALTVSGPVTDSGTGQTVALTTRAGGLTLAGVIDAGGDTLALVSAGSITQPGGSFDVATLSVTAAGSATLTQPGNLVGALGAISTGGGFALVDNQGLTVGGGVTDTGTGATIVLTAGAAGLTLTSAINAPGDTLDLISGGAISQTGGSIQVASLTGSAVGSASLTQAGNLVGALGPFSTTAGFALVDNRALVVNRPLSDSGVGQTVALTTTAGGITLGGAVNAAGDTLDLVSAGAITQTGGSIDVATLTGSAAGSASLTQGGNLVGTLNGFSTGGGLALVDNEALTVAGAVSDTANGKTVALTTEVGDLTLTGVITAVKDTLDLVSAGAISQTAGQISVATLTGSAGTSASFTQASNLVGALGAFSTTAGFTLVDNQALTVNGVVSDSGSGQTVALTTEAGGITLSGATNAGGDTLDLVSAGAINQTGGSIDVATLTGSAVGSASLNQPTNMVGTLGAFTATADFGLTDNEALLVNGPLAVSGLAVGLTTKTGGITLAGAINASGATFDLVSAGAINQSGGSIDVASLTGSAVGSASLTQAGNLVGVLGGFTTTAGFALVDNGALAVSGPLADSGTGQTVALTTETGGITLSGAINAGGDTLALVSAGAISQTGGSIDVATLTGSAATSASLTRATNLIGTLGAFSTTAGFALTDSEALVVNGVISDSGSGQTVTLTTNTGGITLSSAINAAGDTLDIVSAGAINQTGGSIDVATLTGSAAIDAILTQTGNLIGTLGAFSIGTGLALTDNQALIVSGPVTDNGSPNTVELTTEIGDITLAGVINAVPNSRDTLDLISAGAISQTGGSIQFAVLTGSAVGSASLNQAGNQIGTLSGFSTNAGFTLVTSQALTVNGVVSDSGSGQTVALTTGTGGITLASPINAANDTLDLVSAGGITQTSGLIDVATLTGSAGGAVNLNQTGNLVGTLATFSSGGGFALVDNQALVVTGPLTDTRTGQTVALTTQVGDITLAGAVNAGGDTLALVSAGAIAQTGGSIDVAMLTGSAATSASLTQAANVVGTLGAFTTSAGFALVDNAALTVTGPLTDTGVGQTVALTTTSGDITLAGNINATNDTIDLVSAGSITQTGGVIDPVTLTGSAVGSVSLLQPGNLISTLSTFKAGTSFELADSEGLRLTGVLTAPLIFIDMPGDPLTMAAGAALITGGTPPPNQLSITAGQVPPIPPPANGVGAYFKSGTFTQLGTDSVTPIGGGANTILFVDVTNGQNISFTGLTGTTTWLILGLDARGSKVTGKVDVKSLTVTLPPNSVPSDFSVTLSGTVNGVSGQEAAQEAGVIPTKGATLQFNSCPIGTVGCVVLSGVPVPVGNPLQYLTLGIMVAPNDEDDLLLPLVSDEDYLSCLLRQDCN